MSYILLNKNWNIQYIQDSRMSKILKELLIIPTSIPTILFRRLRYRKFPKGAWFNYFKNKYSKNPKRIFKDHLYISMIIFDFKFISVFKSFTGSLDGRYKIKGQYTHVPSV